MNTNRPSREITQIDKFIWEIFCVNKEHGGARIIMCPTDGFFTVEYDAKWGPYGRYNFPDETRYQNFEEAYDMADRTLYSVENDLILVD